MSADSFRARSTRSPAGRRLGCLALAMMAALLAAAALPPTTAWGDTWAAPRNRIFASEYGTLAAKVLVGGARYPGSELVVFRVDADGNEVIVWRKLIAYIPVRLIVADSGFVYGIDEYGRMGFRHAIAVWSPTGEKVADHPLEALLDLEEIRQHVMVTAGSRWWTAKADIQPRHNVLRVRMAWGRVFCVDGQSGAVLRDIDPDAISPAALDEALRPLRAAASQPASASASQPAVERGP